MIPTWLVTSTMGFVMDPNWSKALSIIVPSAISVIGVIGTAYISHKTQSKKISVVEKKTAIVEKKTAMTEIQAVLDANAQLREELLKAHNIDRKTIKELQDSLAETKKEVDILYTKLRSCTEQHEVMTIKYQEIDLKNACMLKEYSALKCEFEEHKLTCALFQNQVIKPKEN